MSCNASIETTKSIKPTNLLGFAVASDAAAAPLAKISATKAGFILAEKPTAARLTKIATTKAGWGAPATRG